MLSYLIKPDNSNNNDKYNKMQSNGCVFSFIVDC